LINREEFVAKAKEGKILAHKCKKCGNLQLSTIVFCGKCYSQEFEVVEVEGKGKVATYTIQNVAPQEYEKYAPYAWVVVRLDAGFNVSGFLPNINSPTNLPINARIKVVGYDEKGILLEMDG
jgi:uncharacterized OB-fold protein